MQKIRTFFDSPEHSMINLCLNQMDINSKIL